jgi:hypothetical protein
MKEEGRSGQKQLEDAQQKLEENGSQIDTMLEGDDSGETTTGSEDKVVK